MGPKKKGKGSKLARMSEEERLRYMQHRAAIEEEARRRKEQLIANYMKNKLKHEEAFSRLNSAKINQQWRQILRKVKCDELKDDMKVLWTTFDAAVITKNRVIETLLADLEDSEIQYSMMLQSHVQVVDRIIGLHQHRLEALHRSHSSEKEVVLSAAKKERAQSCADSQRELLRTVSHDMHCRADTRFSRNTVAATAKQDELRNQMQSEIEKVEEQRGLQIEQMWQDIQQALRVYMADTATNRPHYNSLRAKDTANTEQLMRHGRTVHKYTDMISDLRQQLGAMQFSQTIKLKELREEQSEFLAQFDRLRQSVSQSQAQDSAKLTTLTIASNGVIKDLSKLSQKGVTILQLSSTCHKFLTEKEKLMNYGSALKKDEMHDKAQSDEEADIPFKELENFWHQYNEVVLECEQQSAEKDSLFMENKQLRNILRHYLNTLVRPASVPRTIA